MRYWEIIESRRNPEQNPKVSTLESLEKYAGRDDVFVSFTSDVGKRPMGVVQGDKNTSGSKLGINPKSPWKTPIGIYTYPIDYVISRKGRVPFAAEEPFLYVVQTTKPLLDLNNYSKSDFERDSEKLIDMGFADTRDKGIRTAKFYTPAGHLWNWTRFAARENIARWSKILRSLGYSGAVDCGSGLIHNNEDTQAVFFSIDAVKVLEVIPNRFKSKLDTVTEDGLAIKYIKNPSEEFQLAAVTQNGEAIRYINNPSEAVQLTAVRDGRAIEWIDNPSEQVQLSAVTLDGLAIRAIIRKGIIPSEQVQLSAVKQDGFLIRFIEKPREAVQLAAVTNNRLAIRFIIDSGIEPSDAVKKAAGL